MTKEVQMSQVIIFVSNYNLFLSNLIEKSLCITNFDESLQYVIGALDRKSCQNNLPVFAETTIYFS